MPTGNPPPPLLPPSPGTPANSLPSLIHTRGTASTTPGAPLDVTMDISPAVATGHQHLPNNPVASSFTDPPPLQYLKSLMADPSKRDNLRKLRARVTTIEGAKSYASTAAKHPSKPPPPPTKTDMTMAHPGMTIIHSRDGTAPLKEVGATMAVQKANEVLEKLNATVQGEKVSILAVQFLPSWDVSFISKNRQFLAHGIPRDFNVDSATNKITLALENHFLVEKIFKLRWLGGSRDPADPRQAGTVVITLTNATIADNLVQQRGVFLNSSYHRVKQFKKLPPQCFKCLQMGHFGKWGFKTTIDLTWANFLASRLATSTSTSSNNHGSNHQKLVTTIALAAPKPIFHVVAPKATAVDQDLFRKTLQSNLSQLSTGEKDLHKPCQGKEVVGKRHPGPSCQDSEQVPPAADHEPFP
ncbi:hypothetical protein PCANC_11308 [Puccinia coronata f. sp. avenae]|uniref:Uncharacterized protein n=1 Tax=Puccinia coronata f. sp. avenae TaxID=200324 RepID=A0A2N5V5A5_9BASI|nr:hypothetical protein PCANC_11308 [Puccinia coronata f. sp. avenae]